MKKLLFLLAIAGLLFACSKDDDDITPFGQWTQERLANNPQFNNAESIVSVGKIIMELNEKDSCRYFVRNSDGGIVPFDNSLCLITNESITVKGGRFSPYTNYYAEEGAVIYIHELTSQKMVLRWTTKEVFIPYGHLPQGTYYTEFKRIR